MPNNLTPKEEFLLNPVEEHNITDAAIASFETNLKHPLKVTVPITPIQDLHGMPYPYPAGASVNLIPDTTDTENGYVANKFLDVNGGENANSGFYISEYFNINSGEVYTLTVTSNSTAALCVYNENKEFVNGYDLDSSRRLVITMPENAVYARGTQRKGDGTSYCFMLVKGESSIAPTFENYRKYSNICPIEGYTGANIYHTGANLLNGKTVADILKNRKSAQVSLNEDADGKYIRLMTMSGADINLTETLKFKENTRYTIILTGKNEISGASSTHIRFIYSDGDSKEIYWSAPTEIKTIAVTSAANKTVKAITTLTRIYNTRIYYEKPFGLFEGVVSASSFEEYQGQPIPISWKHAEGTYNFDPIQAGSGDPSPENVRPISSALTLTRDDNSVLTVYGGSITFRDDGTSKITETQRAIVIDSSTAISSASNNSSGRFRVYYNIWADLFPAWSGRMYSVGAINNNSTAPAYAQYDQAFTNGTNVGIMPPSTVQDTESYLSWLDSMGSITAVFSLKNSVTYTLSQAETQRVADALGDKVATTVYNGTVTLNEDGSADLVADKISFTLADCTFYTKLSDYNNCSRFQFYNRLLPSGVHPLICDRLKNDSNQPYTIFHNGIYIYIAVPLLDEITTQEQLRAVYNDAQIVALAKDPQTYHFPNVGQLKAFLGTNNIWSDIGNVNVKYLTQNSATGLEYRGDRALELRRRAMIGDAPTIHTTVGSEETGGLASFKSYIKAPVKKIEIPFGPKQDLHGMPYPYPAGASVNLIPDGTDIENGYVADALLNADGTTTVNTNWYVSEYITLDAETTYTWSNRVNTSINASICFYDENKEYIPGSGIAINAQYSHTFTPPEGTVYARSSQTTYAYQEASSTNGAFQLEVGSTATAYQRYSNICSIDGHDGSNVFATVEQYSFGDVEWASKQYLDLTGKVRAFNTHTYSITYLDVTGTSALTVMLSKKPASGICNVVFYNANKTFISATSIYTEAESVTIQWATWIKNIILPEGCAYIRVSLRGSNRASTHFYKANVVSTVFNRSGSHSFLPDQEGTGDPSPENVRPIHPGLTFTRDDDSVLSVYGGTLTVNADGTGMVKMLWQSYSDVMVYSNPFVLVGDRIANYFAQPSGPSYPICDKFSTVHCIASGNKFLFDPPTPEIAALTGDDKINAFKDWLYDNPVQLIAKISASGSQTEYTLSVAETNRALEALGLTQHIGQIYGGTITINPDGSADVVSDYSSIVLDGSSDENWDFGENNTKFVLRVAGLAPSTIPICDVFVLTTSGSYPYNLRIPMNQTTTSTIAEFKTWLSTNNIFVVYQLAAPQTYHFSNLEQLKVWLGKNNFWCDISDDITVKYFNRG